MRHLIAAAAAGVAALVLVLPADATAPPVDPLPKGSVTTIRTTAGSLVALPRRSGGLAWRLARRVDARVLGEVSEANVGTDVVVVFRAMTPGRVRVLYGLTRGETHRAHTSLTFIVTVERR
jgi:hypothetical protein